MEKSGTPWRHRFLSYSPVELSGLFLIFFFFFVISPGLTRCDTGCLANEAFTSNPIKLNLLPQNGHH